MTARDDYQRLAWRAHFQDKTALGEEAGRALDEIDNLRREAGTSDLNRVGPLLLTVEHHDPPPDQGDIP